MYAVYAHPAGQMTQKLVVLRLLTDNANMEGGIGKRLQDNADEFYDIFRHKGQIKGNALGRAVKSY
jgi:hypothetical protein